MTIYYIYIKTHNKTGLKYLGQTKQEPNIYPGSGIDWTNHIRKYGNTVETQILLTTSNKEERNYWGRYYSNLWKITTAMDDYGNKIWANRIIESGGGQGNKLSREERVKLGKKSVAKQIAENRHNWSKTGKENANYDQTLYAFENIETGEIIETTKGEFKTKCNNRGDVSGLVSGYKKSCCGWKIRGTETPVQFIKYSFLYIKTGEVVNMTVDSFVKLYELNRGHVCQMVKKNKKVHSVKGWVLYSS